MATLGSG